MLTATDLALVRDEIGVSTPPTDDELHTWHTELGAWRLVALRVLKRRRADLLAAAGGGISSVAVPGAVSVDFRGPDLSALDRQIARLEADLGAAGYVSSGRVIRHVAR